MASATTERPQLSDQEFAELFVLMKDADSVELKLTAVGSNACLNGKAAREPTD